MKKLLSILLILSFFFPTIVSAIDSPKEAFEKLLKYKKDGEISDAVAMLYPLENQDAIDEAKNDIELSHNKSTFESLTMATWENSEFGIKFSIKGPYLFRENNGPFSDDGLGFSTDFKGLKNAGVVSFLRDRKTRYGFITFRDKLATDSTLKEYSLKTTNGFLDFFRKKNSKIYRSKKIKIDGFPAIICTFSFDSGYGGKSGGYTVVLDANEFRYRVVAINIEGDAFEDEELSSIIKTLKFEKPKK